MRRIGQMGRMLRDANKGCIPPHGGYAGLLASKALIIFLGTCRFCERFLEKRDRTMDQMIQAARSGKKNIVEGSKISGTSKEAELKLLNVSPSSPEELLEDYSDFLRKRKVSSWRKTAEKPCSCAGSAEKRMCRVRQMRVMSRHDRLRR